MLLSLNGAIEGDSLTVRSLTFEASEFGVKP
jgi:hypothetical protein